MKKYVTKVVKADESGAVGILMTPELLKALDLAEDQVLTWSVSDDKQQIHIQKTALVYQSEAK